MCLNSIYVSIVICGGRQNIWISRRTMNAADLIQMCLKYSDLWVLTIILANNWFDNKNCAQLLIVMENEIWLLESIEVFLRLKLCDGWHKLLGKIGRKLLIILMSDNWLESAVATPKGHLIGIVILLICAFKLKLLIVD